MRVTVHFYRMPQPTNPWRLYESYFQSVRDTEGFLSLITSTGLHDIAWLLAGLDPRFQSSEIGWGSWRKIKWRMALHFNYPFVIAWLLLGLDPRFQSSEIGWGSWRKINWRMALRFNYPFVIVILLMIPGCHQLLRVLSWREFPIGLQVQVPYVCVEPFESQNN